MLLVAMMIVRTVALATALLLAGSDAYAQAPARPAAPTNGGAWILWLRQIELVDGKGGSGLWEPSDGFASATECKRKATDMLAELAKGVNADRQRPNGMMFGAIPIGDNTVTLFLPNDADDSKKSQAFVISIACFPPAFDPRSK